MSAGDSTIGGRSEGSAEGPVEGAKEKGLADCVDNLKPEMVAMMRYSELAPAERVRLKEAFQGFPGEDRVPQWPVIPKSGQEHLGRAFQDDVFIPTKPLRSLFQELGLTHLSNSVQIPGTEKDRDELQGCWIDVRHALEALYGNPATEQDKLTRVQACLEDIYRSLASGKHCKDSNQVRPDLLIVFGGRRLAATARATLAAEVVLSQPDDTDVRVIMSGWHPYYDGRFTFGGEGSAFLPFGEAEAMAVSFEQRVDKWEVQPFRSNPELPRLVLDPRARNTVETLVHSLPVVIETWQAKQRLLNIALVTSPYHLLRTFNTAINQYSHFLDYRTIVGDLYCLASSTSKGLPELMRRDSDKHLETVELYVRESVKLLGGRWVGEF